MDNKAPHNASGRLLNRRQLLQQTGCGFGMLGLSGLLSESGLLAASAQAAAGPIAAPPVALNLPHQAAKAKRVIWLFNHGGPSTIDLFDPKPELERSDGKSMNMGKNVGFFSSEGRLMKSPFKFSRKGKTGTWISDAYPNLSRCVDEMAFIRSVTSESNNHGPALYHMNTGMTRVGFPSVGSWVTYGLGTENHDLPGFVVMLDYRGALEGGPYSWGSGFLPSAFQGTPFRAGGTSPLLDLDPPAGVDRQTQRRQLDLVSQLNQQHLEAHPAEADLLGRIESFELAYRMQMRAPEAIDISREDDRTKAMYGIDRPVSRYYGTQLLMARRLIERGVRFVQIYSGAHDDTLRWDAHADLLKNHGDRCAETDLPTAGLLEDLRQRGLLEDTLVVWAPSSAGFRSPRETAPAAITIATDSVIGWQGPASSPAHRTARPTRSASRPRRTRFQFTTCTRRFSISWVWITRS